MLGVGRVQEMYNDCIMFVRDVFCGLFAAKRRENCCVGGRLTDDLLQYTVKWLVNLMCFIAFRIILVFKTIVL